MASVTRVVRIRKRVVAGTVAIVIAVLTVVGAEAKGIAFAKAMPAPAE